MADVEIVIISETQRTEIATFWATPIGNGRPCLCRAIYDVVRENGHWTYRLRPGSLEILHHAAFGNGEGLAA
jgi:hypothetical protein